MKTPSQSNKIDRRSFIKMLGGGIAVLLFADTAEAQRHGGGGRPKELSAWLHIAEDGTVSIFTGKTEVGQNIRTSLSMMVAEELKVPLSAVQMVMADTDLVPWDAGTFGSRTTPDMSPQLRRVAATAREALIDLAAAAWKVERGTLAAAAGKIVRRGSGHSISYGALSNGQQLVATVDDRIPLTPVADWKVVGKSVLKVNGESFVTGAHQFTTDMRRPGLLFGKVLRAPAYGAKLKNADLSAAESVEGATVHRDGDFIGVAVSSAALGERALALVKTEWEGSQKLSNTELFAHLKNTAKPGSQRPFGVKDELMREFSLPSEKVWVIVPDTGSGYGGKHSGECAIEAARLAKAAGKPVKLVWTREEEFTWAYFRPAGVISMDPLEFRLKNLSNKRLRAVLEAAAERFGWKNRKDGEGRGSGIDKGGYIATCVEMKMVDGVPKLRRIVAAFECGAVVHPNHVSMQVGGSGHRQDPEYFPRVPGKSPYHGGTPSHRNHAFTRTPSKFIQGVPPDHAQDRDDGGRRRRDHRAILRWQIVGKGNSDRRSQGSAEGARWTQSGDPVRQGSSGNFHPDRGRNGGRGCRCDSENLSDAPNRNPRLPSARLSAPFRTDKSGCHSFL